MKKERFVMRSYDYARFKFIKGNRPIDRKHVEELKESIQKNGYYEGYCVLVYEEDGVLFVPEGQHRVIACQELGLPIVYQVVDKEIGLGEIANLNKLQKKWTTEDYINLVAETTNPTMRKILDLKEESGLPYSVVAQVYCRANHVDVIAIRPSTHKHTNINNFEATDTSVNIARNVIGEIKTLEKYHKNAKSSKFISAYMRCRETVNFNFAQLLNNLDKYTIKPHQTINDYIDELEYAHNLQIKKESKRIKVERTKPHNAR